MDSIAEKAREIGRLIAQTDEYKAVRRANDQLGNDREAVELLNQVRDLQEALAGTIRRGEEPSEEEQKTFEAVMHDLQGRAVYQAVVAAQSNMERLMMRVNDEIAQGIEAGEKSRIILS